MSSTRFPANLVPPRRVLLSLLMATALTGCATTPFVARAPDLANSFSVAAPARSAQAPWFQSFQDRRLDELILRALARNLSIQEALAVIDEAEAGTQLARASDFPTLRAGGAAVRGDPDAIGRVSDSTSATLSTSWMLDLFGANRANRAAAVAELEAAQISEEVARRAVTAAVSSAYIDLRFFQESIALTRQSVASRKETLDLTRSMLELGQANRLDVLQAEQAVAQAEANLPSLQIGFDQSLNRLATLTASRTAELRPMLQRGSAQPVARFRPSVGVPAEVIRARPDVQVAERQLASAAARIGVAEAAFWPSVTLSGTITPTDIKGGGSLTSWSIGPQISLPIFTGGANKARLKAAEARAQQAETRWRASVLDAIEEVENGLSAYNRGAANVVAQRRLVASAQETVSLAREIYRSGQSTFFTVLDAERNLLSARAALASAVRDHAAGYVAVSVAAAAPLG